jgi:hypothetical protein
MEWLLKALRFSVRTEPVEAHKPSFFSRRIDLFGLSDFSGEPDLPMPDS